MPGHKTHKKFALFIGVAVILLVLVYKINIGTLGLKEILISIVIAYFASMLPDIDSRASKIRQIAYYLMWGFIFISAGSLLLINYAPELNISQNLGATFNPFHIITAQIAVSLLGFLILSLSHRGKMHNFITGAILSSPLILIDLLYAAVAFVFYSSHIFLDKVAKDGKSKKG